MLVKTIIFDSAAQFLNIKSKRDKKKLCFSFRLASRQKAPEPRILLNDAECTLYLNGTIHPQHNSFFGSDSVRCVPLLLYIGLRNLNRPVFFL